MELRWIIIVFEYGQKTEPHLQYREDKDSEWQDVPIVEIKKEDMENE